MVCRPGRLLLLFVVALGLCAGEARAQAQAPNPELAKIYDEALGWLKGLIQINTTNPPGNELATAHYLVDILQKEGIPAEVLETAPGRGVLVARLQSGPIPDPSRALMLLAHMDVVGTAKDKWSVDPFAAVTKDGYLYGRGAIDDKGMLAANLAVFVALKRGGVRLNRDIVFLADGDEEGGGAYSIKYIIQKYWDKIAVGYCLNEGGRVMLKDGKVQYVGIQASEKVPTNVAVIATGTSGHASMPRPDNAVVHLAAAVAKIGAFQTPVQLNVITRHYFEGLQTIEDEDTAKWIRALLEQPGRQDLAAKRLSEMSPMWNSMMRDSIAPTMLNAGIRQNVVPSEARAVVNIRLLPGNSVDALIVQFKKLVDDPQIRFEVMPDAGQPAPPSSIEGDLFKTIERVSQQVFNGAAVMPFMSTGATDSAQLRLHSVQSYGLLPFPLTEEDDGRMHADDERIPLDSFRRGIDYLYRVVDDFARAK
jgi:acetylornithine deacetylase/succinyl-diaminopimelate desuccinylase-like protein